LFRAGVNMHTERRCWLARPTGCCYVAYVALPEAGMSPRRRLGYGTHNIDQIYSTACI